MVELELKLDEEEAFPNSWLGFGVDEAREAPPLRPNICIISLDPISLTLSRYLCDFHFWNRIDSLCVEVGENGGGREAETEKREWIQKGEEGSESEPDN